MEHAAQRLSRIITELESRLASVSHLKRCLSERNRLVEQLRQELSEKERLLAKTEVLSQIFLSFASKFSK